MSARMQVPEAELIVIHGLWSKNQGLCLWVEILAESVSRTPMDSRSTSPLGKIVQDVGRIHPQAARFSKPGELTPGAAEENKPDFQDLFGSAPLLAKALQSTSRHSIDLWLPTASSAPVPSTSLILNEGVRLELWTVPTVLRFPDRAYRLLKEIADLTETSASDQPPLPEGVSLAPDLQFLAQTAVGIESFIARGRVAPVLVETNGSWWGRWNMLPDAEVLQWLGEAAAMMPPNLRSEAEPPRPAREVLDEFCLEITDGLVRHRTQGVSLNLQHAVRRSPLLSWLTSLDTGEELVNWPEATVRGLASRVDQWRSSAFSAPYELLIRIVEPEASPSASGRTSWGLDLRLRSVHDPSLILTVEEVRARPDSPIDPMEFLIDEVGRAGRVYPPLLRFVARADEDTKPLETEEMLAFVGKGAPELLAAGIAVQMPARWSRPEISLKLHAKTPSNPDRQAEYGSAPARLGLEQIVDYSWEVALGEDVLTLEELTQLAEAKSALVRLRGHWVQVNQDTLNKALAFLTKGTDHGDSHFGELLNILSGTTTLPVPVSDFTAEGWLGDLLSAHSTSTITEIPTPASMPVTLRPYQNRGLSWLAFMSNLGLGVILADDMGLGKTVQLLALLAHEQSQSGAGLDGPTLLVCPMSVVGNWQRESARFAPTLNVYVHHGVDRAKGSVLQKHIAASDLVVTTYALLARDVEELKAASWHRVVLDEAQHVKNANTRQAKAARSIHAAHRIALTGTPIENRLEELRSLLDFTNPGMLGSAKGFRTRFANPIERNGDASAAARLRQLTAPFILRRVKTDPEVITDLPAKHEMTVRANLTAEQASLYQAVVDDMLVRLASLDGMARRGAVLATLTKLKQVCNHPAQFLKDGSPLLRRGHHRSGKLALVEDLVDSILADGEKVLCFTQYREFGTMLQPYLSERFDTPVPFLHGGVPKGKRESMVDEFQSAGGPPILVLSLKAGGTGLNLTAASQVIHLDRWWNPAVEDQATDRTYRIGQHQRVQVRKIICVGTLEERIDAMISEKRGIAELAVGTGENWISEMNDEQLSRLINLSADAVGD